MADISEYMDAGYRAAVAELDRRMADRGVDPETRSRVTTCAAMMYEYIAYAASQRKDPTDKKLLADFLQKKGRHTAKLLGNDALNCALSVMDFLESAVALKQSGGYPPIAVLAWGIALIDLIEVGNSCDVAQQAYYEAFLRTNRVKLAALRTRVVVRPGRSGRALQTMH